MKRGLAHPGSAGQLLHSKRLIKAGSDLVDCAPDLGQSTRRQGQLAQHFASRAKQQAVKNFAFDEGRQDWECMVATNTLEDFRQANRRVASVAACKTSTESPDAEVKRSNAATVINVAAMLRGSPHFRGLVNRI